MQLHLDVYKRQDEKQKEAVKSNVLRILKEKYDVEEEDFLSAELEIAVSYTHLSNSGDTCNNCCLVSGQ